MKVMDVVRTRIVPVLAGGTVMALGAVSTFAADPPTGVAITTEMLKPVVDGVTANLAVIIPVGISIFAIMIGVGLIPKIIKRFTNG